MRINIIFSTLNTNNTKHLLNSIQQQIKLEKNILNPHRVHIHILDKTILQEVSDILVQKEWNFETTVCNKREIRTLETKYKVLIRSIRLNIERDSILRTRIQQFLYINNNKNIFEQSIIWQLDDDMLFHGLRVKDGKLSYFNKNYFQQLIQLYLTKGHEIDAIIGGSSLVPPIPSFLYCESQLKDIIHRQHHIGTHQQVLEQGYHDFENRLQNQQQHYLDLYPNLDAISKVEFILKGIPVSRITLTDIGHLNPRPSQLHRGGNFIIFNPNILDIPHIGIPLKNGKPARRSDMIHALLLRDLNFNIMDIPYFSLIHQRNFETVHLDASLKKYREDAYGALFVKYLTSGKKAFFERLQFYQKHLYRIVALLNNEKLKGHFSKEATIIQNEASHFRNFNIPEWLNKFEQQKIMYHDIKEKLADRYHWF